MQFTNPRVNTGLLFLLALLSGWSFLASREPGVALSWRYGTATVMTICFVWGIYRLLR